MTRRAAARELAARELAALEAELARRSLLGFTRYTFPEYEVNWHHALVARTLDRVFNGQARRVMIFMPPQNGKSELLSRRFPAYVLGRDPSRRVVACSYTASLAGDMSRDVQKIISSPEYRVLFPQTQLAAGRDVEARTQMRFEVVGHRGYYQAAGVDGGITGKSMDLGLIDDPIKNRSEAESEAYRKAVWEWYTAAFTSRQFGADVPIVVTLTRWHEDDLAGRLLRLAAERPDADQWEIVTLPAIREAVGHPADPREVGEALWPSRYPLSELAKRRANSAYDWASLYQQRPAPAEGGLLKRSWWRWYRPDERPRAVDEVCISWDTALRSKQTNDFSVGGAWARVGPQNYALRVVRGRWDFPELLHQMRDLYAWTTTQYPDVVPTTVIENAGAGPEAIAELQRTFPAIVAEAPKTDKVQRVHAVSPIIEGGNVWLPGVALPDGRADATLSPAWVETFVEECAAFPFGTYDDQVDHCTQALRRLQRPRETAGLTTLAGF